LREKISVQELCQIGVFTAIIVACAQIAIPLPGGVPLTLQTWGISLAGMVLGAKNGAIAAIVYLLLGAVGAPVFASFTGGMGIVLGPTGGFILSFPLMAYLAGWGERKGKVIWLVAGLVAGTAANFAVGMLYLSWVMSVSSAVAFTLAVAPFIPTAIIRVALLPVLGRSIKAVMTKARVGI